MAVVAKLKIKVVPGASSAGVHGWLGDSLKVRVTAPPEKGRANKEVEALIGSVLNLRPGAVRVVSGRASPRKVVEVDGLSEVDIRQRLAVADARSGNKRGR